MFYVGNETAACTVLIYFNIPVIYIWATATCLCKHWLMTISVLHRMICQMHYIKIMDMEHKSKSLIKSYIMRRNTHIYQICDNNGTLYASVEMM